MQNYFRYIFIIYCILLEFNNLYSQNQLNNSINYTDLEKKIDNLHDEPEKNWELIQYYIKKSKQDKNNETLVYAYRYASNYSKHPLNIKYADSALQIAKISKNTSLIANAYLNRGIVNMNNYYYQNALDDILIANKFSEELNDDYTAYKTAYLIAQNKLYLGLYPEANRELKKCVDYFNNNLQNTNTLGKNYQIYYIFSLMSYIDSNTKLGKQSDNKALIENAINYLEVNGLKQYIPYFVSSQGTDAFYNKDYELAISKLSEAIKEYNDSWSHITEIYYLGLSNWKLNKQTLAVKYLEEIDKEYNKTKKLDPQFRSAYELLIKYNDSIGNTNKQLEYINKLMDLDRSYEKNFIYLFPRINKEYDTQKLLSAKSKIEKNLKRQKIIILSILFISVLVLLYFVYRNYQLEKIYEARFEKIIATHNNSVEKSEKPIPEAKKVQKQSDFDVEFYSKVPGINPLIVENILKGLNIFEEQEEFLDKQLSQKSLSEKMGTNSSYLSKIINAYKNKSFTIYINDLRLDYIVNVLKNDPRYLNMDIKELALVSGFMNPESFSQNFQRKFELKPSYFIKRLKENTTT